MKCLIRGGRELEEVTFFYLMSEQFKGGSRNMNVRKTIVTCVLSFSLVFSSYSFLTVHAVEFADTIGISSEVSINKLVSLGVFNDPGDYFDPESELTREEFALISSRIIKFNGVATNLSFSDLSSQSVAHTAAVNMVNNGYLKLNGKAFEPDSGVTYSELAGVLARGLGLKKAWTDRPIDFLYYLERKGVLSIDTDLDEMVTREEAAVAVDRFITLKGLFQSNSGIVVETSENGFVVNNGVENMEYIFASNASVFVSGQGASPIDVQVGSPVQLTLNNQGKVAFVSGEILDAETGSIKLENSKWTINGKLVKELNIDAFVAALPNDLKNVFTLKLFDNYQKAGAQFEAQAFFTDKDEVTALYPYIAKAENKEIKLAKNPLLMDITVVFSGTLSQKFKLSETATITVNDKESTLAEIRALQSAGEKITATIEANEAGLITQITAKSEKPAATK